MDNLNQLIIEFYEKLSSWEHSVVKNTELTPTQAHTIEIIGNNGELRMKELAQIMGITTGTLTVMIDKLENNDLVKRKINETDRRSYVICLTSKGESYYEKHHKLHYNLTKELISTLNKKEIDNFSTSLKKILDNF